MTNERRPVRRSASAVSTDGKLSRLSEALGSNAQAASGISAALPDLVTAMGSIGNAFADATSSVRQLTETTASIAENGSIDDHVVTYSDIAKLSELLDEPLLNVDVREEYKRRSFDAMMRRVEELEAKVLGISTPQRRAMSMLELRELAEKVVGKGPWLVYDEVAPVPEDAWNALGRKMKARCLFRHTALRRGKKFIYYT